MSAKPPVGVPSLSSMLEQLRTPTPPPDITMTEDVLTLDPIVKGKEEPKQR